jgi:short-subunit dehydrogenase
MTDTDLKTRFGPAALITGASDGIGLAFAHRLAAAGFDLVLVARREAVLARIARDLSTRHGIRARALPLDLADPAAVPALLAATATDELGLVVAAAGFGSIGPFLERDLADELNMVDLNCRAVVALAHGVSRRMAERGRGGLVLFGSLVGFQGAPNAATYAATKGFVQSFAEALHVELRAQGVSVLAVAPGPVASGFADRAGMQMGATDRPEDVARGALAALGRRATVRPGRFGKLLGWGLGTAPRALRVRIMGRIMAGLIRRDGAGRARSAAQMNESAPAGVPPRPGAR